MYDIFAYTIIGLMKAALDTEQKDTANTNPNKNKKGKGEAPFPLKIT
jgi:hypothetical protein